MRADEAPPRSQRWRRLRGLVAADVDLARVASPDGDPDRLLTSARCRLVKFQRKVVVGHIETAVGPLYVKRYNVHAWRVAIGSIGRRSPAAKAFTNARALARLGFAVPPAVAALEERRLGLLLRSFLVTREVAGAQTVDLAWRRLLAFDDARARRETRRTYARALGDLYRRLHAAGVYHNDLKDVNVLVTGPLSAPAFTLLDLERVTIARSVSRRHRVKNLVQLARTLGPAATRLDRLRFLVAYLGDADRGARRAWVQEVTRAVRRKDGAGPARRPAPLPSITCMVVCQDEAAQIGRCLESVAWCDEIVVVDGGSTDDTADIARRYTDRVITNPWPGYRAQKQLALDASRGDWVLNLDADERVSDELRSAIRRALAEVEADVDGFAIPRLVAYLGRWWYRGGWYPRRALRLVRRSRATWGGTDPHDRAEVAGRIRSLDAPIFHYTYENVTDHVRTVTRLTAVATRGVRPGTEVGATRLVLEPAWRFVRAYVLKRGCLEGTPGFFVAATDAFYSFVRWARVWDRERRA